MPPLTRRELLTSAAASLFVPATIAFPLTQKPSQGVRFEIYGGTAAGFRWRLKAANNKVIATSGEAYTTKAACRSTIDLIKREAATAAVQDLS